MIDVLVLDIEKLEYDFTLELLLNKLPLSFKSRALRYVSKRDSLSFIGGRLLLKEAMLRKGMSLKLLESIRYSREGKPSVKGLFFSISHSKRYVVLCYSTDFDLGIDIEEMANPDLKNFEYLFNNEEWEAIQSNKNPSKHFYWYWVRKEALLKAVGCRLKNLKALKVSQDQGFYLGKQFYFQEIEIDKDFKAIVALEEKEEVRVERYCL